MTNKPTWEDEGEFLEEVQDGDGWTCAEYPTIFDQRRWVTCWKGVYQRLSDKTYWLFSWEEGSTEYQESELNLYCQQVEPVEKTIIVFEGVTQIA